MALGIILLYSMTSMCTFRRGCRESESMPGLEPVLQTVLPRTLTCKDEGLQAPAPRSLVHSLALGSFSSATAMQTRGIRVLGSMALAH
jgi:hypothetical protein